MLDKEKIEEAKEEIFDKEDFYLYSQEVENPNGKNEYLYTEQQIKDAIGLGIRWAIEHFLKDLWHDSNEEPNIIQECIKAVSSGVPNCKLITEEDDSWYTLEEEDIQYLNFKECDLRIKPRYRPFKSVKECWEEMQNHLPFGWVKTIHDEDPEVFIHCEVITKIDGVLTSIDEVPFSYDNMYRTYTFADGTPFGILEEE